jgi:uncharacterized lipoprotein YmbA
MIALYNPYVRWPAAGFLLVLLSACAGGSSPPNRYYVLNAAAGSPATGPGTAQRGPLIGVAPVNLPGYLDQPGITTRATGNEVTRAEFDRWAGPLGSEVARVTGENLSVMVPTERLTVGQAGRSVPYDYLVELEIVTFERDQGGTVQLVARWSLFRENGDRLATMRTSRISKTTAGSDYNSDVAAMSGALEDLCRDIASAIRESAAAPSSAKPKGRKSAPALQ